MPPSVQGTQASSQLEDFVATGNGDPRNRGTLPGATLVVSGFATHAVRLWPFETWGRAIVISDLCRDPVNFHPVLLFSASFSSVVASCCSPILTEGVGRGGGRLSLQTTPVTSSFCFVLWTIFQLVFFGQSSVGFSSFPVSEVPWPSAGLLGRHASVKVWNLLLFWKHFPSLRLPYRLA